MKAGAQAPAASGRSPRGGAAEDEAIAKALRSAADQHLQEGRFGAAIPLLRQLFERDPNDAKAQYALGAALARSGNAAEGLACLQRAVARNHRDPAMRTELGHAFFRLDRFREALGEADEAVALGDDSIHPRMLRVIALERLREFDQAQEAVDRVLQLSPGHADAVIIQARLRRRTEDPTPSIELLRWIVTDTDSEEIRYRALHELGMVLDHVGQYDEAFDAFVASGRARTLTHEVRRYSLDVFPALIAAYAQAIERWSSIPAIDPSVLGQSTPAPAFLVGFPRSGTTLAEQVLAAHPQIITMEERPAVAMVRQALLAGAGTPAALADKLATLTLDQAVALRKRYWELAGSFGAKPSSTGLVLDKLPLNIVELPLIARIFPESRILIALRDPRDVCLSCFMQDFRLNEAMVHFLDWTRTASLYASVMRLWLGVRNAIGNPWHEFRYEDVVADFETSTREVLGFLGLPWDERVLRFDALAATREIRTPSFQAVATAITSAAVGRWHNYPNAIERIMPILGPLTANLGYLDPS